MSKLVKTWIDEGSISEETVSGIELLNEPFGFYDPVWQVVYNEFNFDGYDEIRKVFADPKMQVAVQTGFRDFSEYDNYMQPPVS